MRIGIDAREICGKATGAGRYLAGLLAEWSASESARRHEFALYAPGPIEALAMPLDARRFATRTIAGSGGTWWEQVQLPPIIARDHLDVWFAPAYSAPLGIPIPIVATIHDVSFAAHPEWFALKEGARRRLVVGRTASQARTIITDSEFSRAEIVEHLGVPAAKVRVILPGLGQGRPNPPAVTPRVLYVGSILNRRHVPDLIRAFAPIARDHPLAHLDIVGDNRSFPHEDLVNAIANQRLEAQAEWHRYAPEDRLSELFAEARALAFLSEYEGFGFPPLEALAAGVPPVVLDTPVARETCGDAALYAETHNISAVTRALELALFSDPARAAILDAAPGVLARYQWPRAARETLAVLEG